MEKLIGVKFEKKPADCKLYCPMCREFLENGTSCPIDSSHRIYSGQEVDGVVWLFGQAVNGKDQI